MSVRDAVVADLLVASACDANGRLDAPGWLDGPYVRATEYAVEACYHGVSALWGEVVYRFAFRTGSFRYSFSVRGHGAIDRVRYFAHAARLSRTRSTRLFVPEPNGAQRQYFALGDYARLGVTGARDWLDGNWFFTPGPLCVALEGEEDRWLGVGVGGDAHDLRFTDVEVIPGDGLGLSLRYDGHEAVDGWWEAPPLVCVPAANPYAAVAEFADALRASGDAPTVSRQRPAWWSEPIFCGWGEQVSHADDAGLAPADLSTQANYAAWLARLEVEGIDPGTVVIDDKWQRTYGGNDPDPAKWPDLAGFVAAQHARGRRVLLWLKAWDPEGLAPEECIVVDGAAVAADPTSPAYRARLARSARLLLGEIGADGFTLDFTHRIPSGAAGRSASGAWGVALLRALLEAIRFPMRAFRPDAMLMAHVADPRFADVVDVLRLNDVPQTPGPRRSYLAAMAHRARVARAASPSWLLDTDNWPSPDRASLREYVAAQPSLGVPSLSYATRVRWRTDGEDVFDESLAPDDYAVIREAWARYRASLATYDRAPSA